MPEALLHHCVPTGHPDYMEHRYEYECLERRRLTYNQKARSVYADTARQLALSIAQTSRNQLDHHPQGSLRLMHCERFQSSIMPNYGRALTSMERLGLRGSLLLSNQQEYQRTEGRPGGQYCPVQRYHGQI